MAKAYYVPRVRLGFLTVGAASITVRVCRQMTATNLPRRKLHGVKVEI